MTGCMRSFDVIRRYFIVMGLLLLTAGCGGGGRNDTSGPKPTPLPSSAVPLSTQLRTLQDHDTWEYAFTYHNDNAGPNAFTANGIAVAQVGSVVRNGTSYPTLVYTIVTPSGTMSKSVLFQQDAGLGDIHQVGFEDVVFGVSLAFLPGPWYADLDFIATALDPQYQSRFRVVGSETVETQVGRFEAWRVEQTIMTSTLETRGTYWYAPQLGQPVRSQYTTAYRTGPYAGQQYTCTQSLRYTSVAY